MAWVDGVWYPDTVDEFNATYGEGNLMDSGLNFSDDWASADASWMTDQADYLNDPGFLEWFNSGGWTNDVGFTDFANTPLPGYDAAGNWIGGSTSGGLDFSGIADQNTTNAAGYTDPSIWQSITGGLTSLGGGLGALGTGLTSAIGGLFTQQNQQNQTLAQQQAAAQQQSALASMLGTAGNLYGGYLNTQAAKDAAATQAAAQIQAAQIAADAAKFRPVGVTTNFGQSQFGFDDQGRLTSAGYTLTPEMKAQQQQLMGISQGALDQYGQAQAATAPMAQGSQSMFNLGQQYLTTSPQEQAQKYYADQMALLAPTRAQDMAALQAQMQAQGRGGFAIGGDAGMGAANPQLQAMLNAQRQQDLGLAAQATQGGMDYAKFGAGMMGLGGNALRDMYGTQQAAYAPYQQALGGAQNIEGMGQDALKLGMSLGSTATAANAMSGQRMAEGMTGAANTIGNTAQAAGSTWGNLLQGAAPTLYNWGQ